MLMRMSNDLHYFKTNSEVKDPIRATEGSACFDLHSYLPENSEVKAYLNCYEEVEKRIRKVVDGKVQVKTGGAFRSSNWIFYFRISLEVM